jgi:DNA polymerase I-like protein with 3'-5' exonuclease and polymerase domains
MQVLRKTRKLVSTYLRTDEDADKKGEGGGAEYKGRVLYAINPHGTDTGRSASSQHHFWCGLQIHNIPQGNIVKRTLIADPGFRLGEVDLEQAETRDTAYAAGELAMIAAVEGSGDFHSLNASAFFGIPYNEIYDDALGKVLNKLIRTLAKRVNHGANYLMGENVLVDTMGDENIWEAKKLLKLPSHYGLIDVARYLLEQFHKTYPKLRGQFYPSVVSSVVTTKMLVGATGWTRYCFKDPTKNKRDKNAYVAHVAQSLNAMVLNKAWMKVFNDISMHPDHMNNFKLLAQIHDSILFQFREGHEYLADMVKKAMEIPILITGCDGVERRLLVPAAIKTGKDGLGAYRWSETE